MKKVASCKSYKTITVSPASELLGAEIGGVRISDGISDEQFEEIERAYYEYGVIFFRDQPLTPEEHIAFARLWGKICVNRFFTPLDGYPLVATLIKEPDQKEVLGGKWHADHSYEKIPAMGSILYAKEVPAKGGDTLFASTRYAYETLSEELKARLSNMKAVHSSEQVFGVDGYAKKNDIRERLQNAELANQTTVHPVIIRHPVTGQKLLYVNPNFTVRFEGMTEEQSQPLLDELYAHLIGTDEQNVLRFKWEKDSIAFWDNRAVVHKAVNDYFGRRRVMHRVTVEGVSID